MTIAEDLGKVLADGQFGSALRGEAGGGSAVVGGEQRDQHQRRDGGAHDRIARPLRLAERLKRRRCQRRRHKAAQRHEYHAIAVDRGPFMIAVGHLRRHRQIRHIVDGIAEREQA